MNIDAGVVSGIASLIVSLVTIYLAVIKAKTSKNKSNGTVAQLYEEMANRQLKRIDEQQKQIDGQRNEINIQKEQIESIIERADRLECQLHEAYTGIKMLIDQIKANGLLPVWMPKDEMLKENNNQILECTQEENPKKKSKK